MTSLEFRPLIAELEKRLEGLNPSDIPLFVGELERLKVLVSIRIMNELSISKDMINVGPSSTPLLTIPEAADRLAITKGRAYELSRQGRLPTVKIGRYVRIDPKELEVWIERQKGLDNGLYSTYSSLQRDRKGIKTSTKATGADSSRSIRKAGCRREHCGPMGTRRASNQKANRTPNPTALSDPKTD